MNKAFLVAAITFVVLTAHGQAVKPSQQYQLVTGNNIIQAKNYYLLTLLQQNSAARQLLEKDTVLTNLLTNKLDQLTRSLKECDNNAFCYTERMKFSDEEISKAGARLAALYSTTNALGKLVQQDLIPSGSYFLFSNLSPRDLLVKAWEQDANGINFVIGVYAEGKKANYPLIDSIAFAVSNTRYSSLVYTAAYAVIGESRNTRLFFQPSLVSALHFLEINERNNAGDYEPMSTTVNKAAFDRVKTIKWNNYKYSVILVPGAGPEEPTVALSAEGMLRCRIAAEQYRQQLAPFIVVSGGKVHPYKTKYCEALEMRDFLVNTLKIPANAVIMEPHARHTTTNLRNCARLIFRYGMPFDKPCLTSTSRGQSLMIATTLAARCQKELNATPFRIGSRLSETEVEFYPLLEALHINPTEPMDP